MNPTILRNLFFALAILFPSFSPAQEEQEPNLDSMLKVRIELNEKYRDDFTEEAKELSNAKELAPLETRIGDAWVNYLRYVLESKDNKLKVHALRLEYLDELRNCLYDLEYEDSLIEKVKIKAKVSGWKKLLTQLDQLAVMASEEG